MTVHDYPLRYLRLVLARIATLFSIAAAGLWAQDMQIGKCNLSIAGAPGKEGFLQFDRELRDALARQDPVKTALLIDFPLSVNVPGQGSISISDVGTLEARYSEVFPSAVRRVVLEQNLGDLFCNDSGIMYGNGTVWIGVTEQAYGVKTINLPRSNGHRASAVMTCNAEQRRAAVDLLKNGTLRYRVWDRPHSLLGDPDVEVVGGTTRVEGTGACASRYWTFQRGGSEFTLSTLGCPPESTPPPEGARGHLTISRGGQTERSWCY